jgi:hypothetical protein
MSTINTNGINVNYPVPGENNSSQGFRDNFTNIKNNINTAGTEITELQNKGVFKTGLTGIPVDNNMANTLISNAAVRGFRSTTYNLGNAISGSVVIDATLGDVQFGTITGNTTLQLAGWAPSGTRSAISLDFTIANTEAYVIFPGTVNASGDLIENNTLVGGNLAIATAPYSVTNLKYELSTTNCGNTITINPLNRPYQTSQIETRQAITPTGYQGDRNGDIAVAPSIQPVTVTAIASDVLTTGSTAGFYLNMPIQFYGVVLGNIVAGTTYYVRTIVANTSFTVSATVGGGDFAAGTDTGTMQAKPVAYVYLAVGEYDSTTTVANVAQTFANNYIDLNATVSSVVSYGLNQPVVFTGNVATSSTNLVANTTYYVKAIDTSGNTLISVSRTRTNGVADANVTLIANTAISGSVLATFYTQGNDIWKRIQLDSF